MAGKHPDWHLDIFGKGFLREPLERRLAVLGLEGQARLNGPTDRLGRTHARCLCVRPLVALRGLPDRPARGTGRRPGRRQLQLPKTGPNKILTDGTNGLLVPAEDVPALAAALDRVMTDEPLRRRLSAATPAAVFPYSRQKVGQRWDELLEGDDAPRLSRSGDS